MKTSRVVTIDLGSAFAKIAVREQWNQSAKLLTGMTEAVDKDFCIPTTVARIDASGQTKWAAGLEAAEQNPGPNVHIYKYWKKSLFADSSLSDGTAADLEGIATAFFSALRKRMFERGPFSKYRGIPLRICVPKLPHELRARELLRAASQRAGFILVEDQPFVYEPVSNIWGVITRGRNRTYYDNSRRDFEHVQHGRKMLLGDMLDSSGLLEAMRREGRPHNVLALDIGAYTTDISMITFDTGFGPNWDRPEVAQVSVELGITELDEMILAALPNEAEALCRQLSSAEWDRRKAQLYRGDEIELVRPQQPKLRVGGGSTRDCTNEQIADFGSRVVNELSKFAKTHAQERVYATYLTGGGAMISAVRSAICDSPLAQTLRMKDPVADVPSELKTPAEVDAARQVLQLARGSSAIGGCSVFFQ